MTFCQHGTFKIFLISASRVPSGADLGGGDIFTQISFENVKSREFSLQKKKKVVKILENFLKIRPPLEKILDPPLGALEKI